MTMLGKTDGANADDGSSYLDIVSFLKSYGANPKHDIVELWKRIVFNMAVNNTDDHLRNHGFILTKSGWVLSPLYDVNPVPFGDKLSLNVDANDNRVSADLAIKSASYYNLKEQEAIEYANEIIGIVNSNWEKIAAQYGLSRSSIEYMRPAFSLNPIE